MTLENKVDGLAVTVDKLAEMIKKGFKSVKSQNTENLESLARSVNGGFEDAEKRVNDRFDIIDERFDSLESSIKDRLYTIGDELRGQQDKMARVEKVLKIG